MPYLFNAFWICYLPFPHPHCPYPGPHCFSDGLLSLCSTLCWLLWEERSNGRQKRWGGRTKGNGNIYRAMWGQGTFSWAPFFHTWDLDLFLGNGSLLEGKEQRSLGKLPLYFYPPLGFHFDSLSTVATSVALSDTLKVTQIDTQTHTAHLHTHTHNPPHNPTYTHHTHRQMHYTHIPHIYIYTHIPHTHTHTYCTHMHKHRMHL